MRWLLGAVDSAPNDGANVLCLWIHSESHVQNASSIYIENTMKNFKFLRGRVISDTDLEYVLFLTLQYIGPCSITKENDNPLLES